MSKVEIYAMTRNGKKYAHVDYVNMNGRVSEREAFEGYAHGAVDEYSQRAANELVSIYGTQPWVDLGTVPQHEFNRLSGR